MFQAHTLISYFVAHFEKFELEIDLYRVLHTAIYIYVITRLCTVYSS